MSLFDLHEQWVVVVTPQQHDDPGAGADAAHSDHLAGHPRIPEPRDEAVPTGVQAFPVLIDESPHLLLVAAGLRLANKFVDRNEQRWVAGQATLSVDRLREL